MGTHPIFESDFDCLTEWLENCHERRKKKKLDKKNERRKKSGKKIKNKCRQLYCQHWPWLPSLYYSSFSSEQDDSSTSNRLVINDSLLRSLGPNMTHNMTSFVMYRF